MAWLVDAAAWVWWCNDLGSRCSGVGLVFDRGLLCFVLFCFIYLFIFLVLTIDYGLLVVVVSGVCSVVVVMIVVLEQKERERNNVLYGK